jgi:uncharacterized protein
LLVGNACVSPVPARCDPGRRDACRGCKSSKVRHLLCAMNKAFFISPLLLVASNVFMTFAWYGHLKNLHGKPWFIAALASWAIALLEYLFQVPANRIGFGAMSLAQLKVMQEVITLSVFVPFAVFYMNQPIKLDFVYAGLCLLGAVYFVFRS